MAADDVRSRVAELISSETASLPTSSLGRAGWLGGLARAGAKSIGRTVRRTIGGGSEDVEPEAEVAASFGQLKGPIMKMGQMLGYVDVGLPEALRSAFSALHTNAQPLDAHRMQRVLDEDLGDPGRALARAMAPQALSAASVGQVHRSSLPDGTAVAVKVLHPGLATVIERDFAPALFASRIAPSVHAMLVDVRERLLEECDYFLEARRQSHFREILAGHPTLVIPKVYDELSSARVLTTTFLDGVHLDRFLASSPPQEARDRAGAALFDFYFAPLFKHGLYNGDPHPGNYIFLPDGKLGVVDFGCTREFEPAFVGHLASLTSAVMEGAPDRMHDALVALGVQPSLSYDRAATQRLLRGLLGPLAHDGAFAFDLGAEIHLGDALKSAWKARKLALSGELLFLLRTLLGLSSVLAKIGARANWRRRLEHVIASSPVVAAARAAAGATSGNIAVDGSSLIRPAKGTTRTQIRDTSWDVVLVDGGETRIALLRALREITGQDLRDLELLVDSLPETLTRSVPRSDAERLRTRLEKTGAIVEVRRAPA